jgi:hypothetical protein
VEIVQKANKEWENMPSDYKLVPKLEFIAQAFTTKLTGKE